MSRHIILSASSNYYYYYYIMNIHDHYNVLIGLYLYNVECITNSYYQRDWKLTTAMVQRGFESTLPNHEVDTLAQSPVYRGGILYKQLC